MDDTRNQPEIQDDNIDETDTEDETNENDDSPSPKGGSSLPPSRREIENL